MSIYNPKQKGFSNLELVIVIVVILVLVLVSFITLNDQRTKARDAKRINDIKQIRVALEMYYSKTGEYPIIDQAINIGSEDKKKLCSKDEGMFVTANTTCIVDSTFMSDIPTDSITGWQFTYTGATNGYDLTFKTEKDSILGPAGIYHAHSQKFDQQSGNK